MAYYYFKEVNKAGEIKEGNIEAANEQEVIQLIKSQGKMPIIIEETKNIKDKKKPLKKKKSKDKKVKEKEETNILNAEINISFLQPKVKLKDIAVMCRQMGTMLVSGMDLIRTVEVLTNQSEHPVMKKTLKEISLELRKGNMLSRSLRDYPKVFPELLIAMVESGELTGTLDQVMESMAEHYKKEDKINRQIKSAMVYPIVLAIAATLVVSFLMIFVMPIFIEMFEGQELPALTQFLLNISNSLRMYWYIYLTIIIGIIVLSKALYKKPDVRYEIHRIMISIPVMGTALSKIASARFSRTLATLLGSGIPIVRALEAAAKVTNNEYVIQQMEEVIEEIKKGRPLNVLLKDMEFFPPMMVSMVAIGEESGDIELMLVKTADYYDDEMEAIISDLVSIIEPIMIIIMAVVIGVIVIAMFLPVVDSLSNLQNRLSN